MPEPKGVYLYTKGEIAGDYDRILDDLAYRSTNTIEKLERISQTMNRIEAEDALFKTAFNEAIADVQASDIELVINEMMRALYQTKEFNFSLYAERLFTALRQHSDEILVYLPNEFTRVVNVTVNLEPLGEVNMWGQAVEAVREAHGWGGKPLSSHMWKEKVYRPGREGANVENSKGEDVTEKYSELYEQTIAERLSLIPEQYAPFWYIIEHGNATGIENFPDHEGTAYPIVEPTNVANKIRITLERKFRDVISDYIAEAERLYSNMLYSDFGVTGYSDTFKDFIDDAAKDVGDILNKEVLKTAATFKTIETIERNGKIYEVHKTRAGRLGLRYSLGQNR